jgi:hypothetical protein
MPKVGTVDLKLEVVTLPVCDVDRARYKDPPRQFPWPPTKPAVPVSSFDLKFPQVGPGQLDEFFAFGPPSYPDAKTTAQAGSAGAQRHSTTPMKDAG